MSPNGSAKRYALEKIKKPPPIYTGGGLFWTFVQQGLLLGLRDQDGVDDVNMAIAWRPPCLPMCQPNVTHMRKPRTPRRFTPVGA